MNRSAYCRRALRCVVVWLGLSSALRSVRADPEMMTRQAIIDLAASGVGNGYMWGGSRWTRDPAKQVKCSHEMCDGCSCVMMEKNMCSAYFPTSRMGSDCAGYVSKSWQLPGPTPIEVEDHYAPASKFMKADQYWTPIAREELKRGDSLAISTHVVMFEAFASKGQYLIYEAEWCASGIMHHSKVIGDKYVAARRNLLAEVECKPDTCNNHGACSTDNGCHCDTGYAGTNCQACAEGYSGYPSCTPLAAGCKPHGSLRCGDAIDISPTDGSQVLSDYACGASGLTGNELVFRFSPVGEGRANISLDQKLTTAKLLLMRHACGGSACVKAAADHIDFEYGAGEVYYLSVDTQAGATGMTHLQVDCAPSTGAFIGDSCDEDSDCNFNDAQGNAGRCYRNKENTGFCTSACTTANPCPNLPGSHAETACVHDPNQDGAGICVPKSDRLNNYCGTVPGTVAQPIKSFAKPAVTVQACFPSAPVACQGRFGGSVVAANGGAALPTAMVDASGAGTLTLNTDDRGMYESTLLPCGTYKLKVSLSGYASQTIQLSVTGDMLTQVPKLALLSSTDCPMPNGGASGLVFNGITATRDPIAGATLMFVPGLSVPTSGAKAKSVTSGADGTYMVDGLATGHYVATATATGFQTATADISVCGGQTQAMQDISLTPSMQVPMRVVLRWKQPDDLDLHVQTPQGTEVYFDNFCHGDLDSAPYAHLDIDRRHADGPETVSFSRFVPGTYTVFVHNYSQQNHGINVELSNSSAEVTVYGKDDAVVAKYAVPSSGTGFFWDVFTFEGTDPYTLKPIQTIGSSRANSLTDYHDCHP